MIVTNSGIQLIILNRFPEVLAYHIQYGNCFYGGY